jgi:NADPH-dependent 2,4-dienoyl-CoA reductase/sulfur reductase-like enzyme
MEYDYDYLIVGAGMTADAAAKSIRKADAEGRIGIIGDEPQAPYERPPLSKSLWKGDKPVESIDLATERSGAVLHLGRRVKVLDCVDRSARDGEGDIYRYRRLLLATGATPRKLPIAGPRVINFRTLDDYLALRRYAVSGARIAVVGGGFIGSELAASLASNGCKVTMLFPGEAIGAGRYPSALAHFLNAYYRERSVELKPGAKSSPGSAWRRMWNSRCRPGSTSTTVSSSTSACAAAIRTSGRPAMSPISTMSHWTCASASNTKVRLSAWATTPVVP